MPRKFTCVTRDPNTGEVLAEAEARGMSLSFSPDGGTVAIPTAIPTGDDEWKQLIIVLETEQLDERRRIPVDVGSRLARFSPNGQLLAVNSSRGVNIWDISGGESELLSELQTSSSWIWDIRSCFITIFW